ncbi:MAG: hypothetical protein WKF87_12090 [Chryseolinea sp.]
MNPLIYNGALALHITGICVMAGATLVDYFGIRAFWKTIRSDRPQAIVYLQIGTLHQRLMSIGMVLIIISGVAMMFYMHAVWGQQVWFQIKFGLLIIIIVNGLFIVKLLRSRLVNAIHIISPQANITLTISRLRKNLSVLQQIQLMLFLAIFILSVFKFN